MAKQAQNLDLETRLIQIPIDKYTEDIDTELGEEKKNKILDLLLNSNNLRSEEEFEEIEENLYVACQKGDLELIKIYLSESIQNDSKTITFKIDKTNQTASLFKVSNDLEELVIPRTVNHGSINYLITSISGLGIFNIKKIKFVEDSAVETIYGFIFGNLTNTEEIN